MGKHSRSFAFLQFTEPETCRSMCDVSALVHLYSSLERFYFAPVREKCDDVLGNARHQILLRRLSFEMLGIIGLYSRIPEATAVHLYKYTAVASYTRIIYFCSFILVDTVRH